MVVLDIKLDNFLVFNDFSLNLSYPKKPVNSVLVDEYLEGRPNFRYKKMVVLMGANATGKTALGNVLCGIFNFIARREYAAISGLIEDPLKPASFSIDVAFPEFKLYRISARFNGGINKKIGLSSNDINVEVKSESILKSDSYERCVGRLNEKNAEIFQNYIQALESIPQLTWKFEMLFGDYGFQQKIDPVDPRIYSIVLEKTLKALDPRIQSVEMIEDNDNTYSIRYQNHSVLIKDGVVVDVSKLSSGTREGIGIADLITAMTLRATAFMFCDEKLSHVHSSAEKAFLSLLIDMIGQNQQLFFTTHNSDVLDMNLPFHSFAFLRRDEFDDNKVSCVFASDYLKKNNMSLKNAVENDVFSTNPDTDRIYQIGELFEQGRNEQ